VGISARSSIRSGVEGLEGKILELLARRSYDEADRATRLFVEQLRSWALTLSEEEVWRFVNEVTGGLGYTEEDRDVCRVALCGSLISWAEVVKDGFKVLEVGTGLGRTCYTVLFTARPSLYLSIDNSPQILALALYRNPYEAFRRALGASCVKLCLCDAVKAVKALREEFDHVIHDGGPNPNRNPKLYSEELLEDLARVLRRGGTMSVFAGRNKSWQDRIYLTLRSLGFDVSSVSFPFSPVLVFHCVKK